MINQHIEDAKIFKALSDEKQLSIFNLLESGEKCACILIDETTISPSALSYHMKILYANLILSLPFY